MPVKFWDLYISNNTHKLRIETRLGEMQLRANGSLFLSEMKDYKVQKCQQVKLKMPPDLDVSHWCTVTDRLNDTPQQAHTD